MELVEKKPIKERREHPRVPGAFKAAEDVAYKMIREQEQKCKN